MRNSELSLESFLNSCAIPPSFEIFPATSNCNVPGLSNPETTADVARLHRSRSASLSARSDAAENALLRRIDLTTLRLFIAVCEEKNLTRAAMREGIAASAVSKRMNDFETAFGVSLFERLSKGMALTPAGEALLHHARVTLLNVEKIAVELAEYSKGRARPCPHARQSLGDRAVPARRSVRRSFGAHGLLRVDLQERPSAQVVRGIEEGAAEIGICSGAVETRASADLPLSLR